MANFPLNIVRLTYREHYIAHLCLYKLYENDEANRKKMTWAWIRMCKHPNKKQVTSHEYDLAKNHLRKMMLGSHPSKDTLMKLKGRPSPNKGKKFSIEHKAKLSAAHKGKIPWNKGQIGCYSDEQRKNISDKTKEAMKRPEIKEKIKMAHELSNGKLKSYMNTQKMKEVISNRFVGLLFWNNGKINKRSKECPGEGWKRGKL